MQKTLGGDRLGSGNKMKVDLHGFERSTHDLSYIWRSTMSAGTLVPFMKELALPGDTFDIDLDCDIKTHPTVGPLFGSYKVQLDVFVTPCRLYNSATHNNMLNIGLKMQNIKLPKVRLFATPFPNEAIKDLDNEQINPSCIFSYLGIRGIGQVGSAEGVQGRKFNAVPWLAYWDIYKNYYSNKQEEEGVVLTSNLQEPDRVISGMYYEMNVNKPINEYGQGITQYILDKAISINYSCIGGVTDPSTVVLMFNDGTSARFSECMNNLQFVSPISGWSGVWDVATYGTKYVINWRYIGAEDLQTNMPRLFRFPLNDIDTMREWILRKGPNQEFVINDDVPNLYPYMLSTAVPSIGNVDFPVIKSNQEGLGVKTYQSDLFNNWLSTEWIDGVGGINEITAVDTSSGSFNIDALNLSRKVYDMLNRIAVSGGTYDDWINAAYGHEAYNRAQTPVYMGGLIKELVFQEVVSNAQADNADGTQPLGTLAGKGVMGRKHKGGKVVVRVDEPSYIMGIISLTPRIDYSQGNKWDVNLETWDDFHKPNLDAIGFQELITEQMAWWTTTKVLNEPDTFVQTSAGKQPAWVNYMTNVNEVRGNFAIAGNEMFMTLNRRYEPNYGAQGAPIGIDDLTTYIDPSKFNFIFAQTSIDSQNFWAQIAVDITARRKMSAKVMPNL